MFRSLDTFARALRHAAICPPGQQDHRLQAASGLNSVTPADGGFLVPPTIAEPILARAYATGQILGRVTRVVPDDATGEALVPIVAESSRVAGSRYGGLSVAWVETGAAPTASKPQFGRLDLRKKSLRGLVYTTGQMFESGAPGMSAFLETLFSIALVDSVEAAIVSGTGAGQPLGVLNAPCKLTCNRTGTGVASADVRSMVARLWGPSRSTAVWLASESVTADILATADDGLVTYAAGGQTLLCGIPVLWSELCSARNTSGDLILMDPAAYALSMGPLAVEASEHVRFAEDEVIFRLSARADGMPTWECPVDPRDGSSDTLSTVVVLS